MANAKDILQNKDANNDCFSDNYASVVSRLLSSHCLNKTIDTQHEMICDSHLQETNTKRIKEELVRCIWYGQHYKNNSLFTEDGLRLEIISPGGWNVEDGPDFYHSEILFSNCGIKKGDVEVHVYSTDWDRHGHNLQEAYNKVCLHVAMWNDGKNPFVYNKDGCPVPQLALHKYLDDELDELFESIDIKEYPEGHETMAGACKKSIAANELNTNMMGIFLDYAGDERIASKAKRFRKLIDNGSFEQTLYEAIMETLGYKNNKAQFIRLANLFKFNDIQEIVPVDLEDTEKILYIQAAFLGMAGLLPSQIKKNEKNKPDQETVNYIKKIEDIWNSKISDRLDKQPMDGRLWQFSKSRPANFPTRRLAAMGHITARSLTNGGLLKSLLTVFEKAESYRDNKERFDIIAKGIESLFLEIFDDYWSYYYTFNARRLSAPERLIGKERTSDILINTIIPILLINARKSDNIVLEKMLHLVFKMYPKQSSNNIIRFMISRIFGNEKEANKIVNNVRRQQGLHQIFKDFCDSDNFLCNKCALYLVFNA